MTVMSKNIKDKTYISNFCGHSSFYARELSHRYFKCSSNDGACKTLSDVDHEEQRK